MAFFAVAALTKPATVQVVEPCIKVPKHHRSTGDTQSPPAKRRATPSTAVNNHAVCPTDVKKDGCNPLVTSRRRVDREHVHCHHGNEAAYRTLASHLDAKESVVLVGINGTGKTSAVERYARESNSTLLEVCQEVPLKDAVSWLQADRRGGAAVVLVDYAEGMPRPYLQALLKAKRSAPLVLVCETTSHQTTRNLKPGHVVRFQPGSVRDIAGVLLQQCPSSSIEQRQRCAAQAGGDYRRALLMLEHGASTGDARLGASPFDNFSRMVAAPPPEKARLWAKDDYMATAMLHEHAHRGLFDDSVKLMHTLCATDTGPYSLVEQIHVKAAAAGQHNARGRLNFPSSLAKMSMASRRQKELAQTGLGGDDLSYALMMLRIDPKHKGVAHMLGRLPEDRRGAAMGVLKEHSTRFGNAKINFRGLAGTVKKMAV